METESDRSSKKDEVSTSTEKKLPSSTVPTKLLNPKKDEVSTSTEKEPSFERWKKIPKDRSSEEDEVSISTKEEPCEELLSSFVGANEFLDSKKDLFPPLLKETNEISSFSSFARWNESLLSKKDTFSTLTKKEPWEELLSSFVRGNDLPKERDFMKGTRTWVFEKYNNWIEKAAKNKNSQQILTLTAPAGFGKTQIAYEIVDKYCNDNVIAWYFFRYDQRNDVKIMLLSLSYQLAKKIPEYAKELNDFIESGNLTKDKLENENDIEEMSVDILIQPLTIIHYKNPKTDVIVIDGLDECSDDGQKKILDFIKVFRELPKWLKIFTTTGPDSYIFNEFTQDECWVIEPKKDEKNETDIKLYYENKLKESNLTLKGNRDTIIDNLWTKSGGLFLDAQFLMRSLMYESDPVTNETINSISSSHQHYYEKCFKSGVFLKKDQDWNKTLEWMILQIVIVAAEPMSLGVIQELTECDENLFREAIKNLSIFLELTNEDEWELQKVSVFHKSFYDWLATKQQQHDFFVDKEKAHEFVGTMCLEYLKKNKIANGIDNTIEFTKLSNDIDYNSSTLQYELRHGISHSTLQYVLCHGISHLYNGQMKEEARKLLLSVGWITTRLFVCKNDENILDDYKKLEETNDTIVKLIGRVIYLASITLGDDPRHLPTQLVCRLYRLLEYYTKRNDALSKKLCKELSIFIKKLKEFSYGYEWWCPDAVTWEQAHDPLLLLFEGNNKNDDIEFVLFTPDDTKIASCGDGGPLFIWNVYTGEIVKRYENSGTVRAGKWHDNDNLILASNNVEEKSIRIWSTNDITDESILKGHTDTITAIKFSNDKKLVASSGDDNFIRIWDLDANGQCKHIFPVEDVYFISLSWSPDDKWLVSRVPGITFSFWNIVSGESTSWDAENDIECVDWCPNIQTSRIAFSDDYTITVLDCFESDSGTLQCNVQHTLKLDNMIDCIKWSPDGKSVAIGMKDTIQIWNPESNKCHTSFQNSQRRGTTKKIQWSHDGMKLVSGDSFGICGLWSLSSVLDHYLNSNVEEKNPPKKRSYISLIWKVLQVIAVAKEPMTLEMIRSVSECQKDDHFEEVIKKLYPYLKLINPKTSMENIIMDESSVSVDHKTLVTLMKDTVQHFDKSYIDPKQAHELKAKYCLQYLNDLKIACTEDTTKYMELPSHFDYQSSETKYVIQYGVYHLCEANMLIEARQILLNVGWIVIAAQIKDSNEIVNDYQLFDENDVVIQLIAESICKSSNAIQKKNKDDWKQLPSQIIGRLYSSMLNRSTNDKIQMELLNFITRLRDYSYDFSWWCPIRPTWEQAEDVYRDVNYDIMKDGIFDPTFSPNKIDWKDLVSQERLEGKIQKVEYVWLTYDNEMMVVAKVDTKLYDDDRTHVKFWDPNNGRYLGENVVDMSNIQSLIDDSTFKPNAKTAISIDDSISWKKKSSIEEVVQLENFNKYWNINGMFAIGCMDEDLSLEKPYFFLLMDKIVKIRQYFGEVILIEEEKLTSDVMIELTTNGYIRYYELEEECGADISNYLQVKNNQDDDDTDDGQDDGTNLQTSYQGDNKKDNIELEEECGADILNYLQGKNNQDDYDTDDGQDDGTTLHTFYQDDNQKDNIDLARLRGGGVTVQAYRESSQDNTKISVKVPAYVESSQRKPDVYIFEFLYRDVSNWTIEELKAKIEEVCREKLRVVFEAETTILYQEEKPILHNPNLADVFDTQMRFYLIRSGVDILDVELDRDVERYTNDDIIACKKAPFWLKSEDERKLCKVKLNELNLECCHVGDDDGKKLHVKVLNFDFALDNFNRDYGISFLGFQKASFKIVATCRSRELLCKGAKPNRNVIEKIKAQIKKESHWNLDGALNYVVSLGGTIGNIETSKADVEIDHIPTVWVPKSNIENNTWILQRIFWKPLLDLTIFEPFERGDLNNKRKSWLKFILKNNQCTSETCAIGANDSDIATMKYDAKNVPGMIKLNITITIEIVAIVKRKGLFYASLTPEVYTINASRDDEIPNEINAKQRRKKKK